MDGSLTFGRIFGIPLKLHISWFLILLLISGSLAMAYFPDQFPEWSPMSYWIVGLVTAILFFGSVLIHELGHSIIALRDGVPVQSITLFIFGGVAQIGREPDTAESEFRIAIAGPITSLALAAIFLIFGRVLGTIPEVSGSALYLGQINLILAVFNMLPGFPLDGGRVLRAILWKFGGNFRKATHWATSTGQAVAFLFIGLGVWLMFSGNFINGLWFAFIGWFLSNAAQHSYRQVLMRDMLAGVTARQLMVQQCQVVSPKIRLDELVDRHVLGDGQRCFFVAENEHMQGLLTLSKIKSVDRDNWRSVTTEEVMVPLDEVLSISPDEDAWNLLRLMDENDINQVPVMENDQLMGIITRDRLLHYIRTRSELGY
ncbi:MAG: site-2 protease family protein [Anaerolineales bacterium]|nr:site-2 protease family protein [Anaerolineales bacterium]